MASLLRSQFVSTVQQNLPLCREHWRLTLRLDSFPPTEPGQFLQISCRDLDDIDLDREIDWEADRPPRLTGGEIASHLALLRRPFSLAGRRDSADGVELDFIHRVVGVGTEWLSQLKPGDKVFLLGPLGNRFTLPQNGELAILVGGGVGIPPMLYLAEKLANRPAAAFCGALTRDHLPLSIDATQPAPTIDDATPRPIIKDFSRYGIPTVISTDDGSYGFRGYVTQALEKFLATLQGKAIIYTCGPELMMKRVADIATAHHIECQIAVERAMACGMGTCQSCVIRVREGEDWRYRLACTDGPVFRAAELLW